MNQRLTRKEIKRDEFANAVGRSVVYAEQHSRGLIVGVGLLLVVVAVGVAVYLYLSHRAQQGEEALAYAMKVDQAPIDPAAAKPQDRGEPSFANEAARQARAVGLFERVRKDYGGTVAADVAGLYLATIEAGRGHFGQARQLWNGFVEKHGRHALAAQARLNLINLDRKEGRASDVVQQMRAMLDQSEPPLPQDVILFELAATLEQLNRGPEAIQSYQRIIDEFPQSGYRQPAQQRLSALDPARANLAPGMAGGFPGAATPAL